MTEHISLAELARELGAELRLAQGQEAGFIPRGLNTLQGADASEISFLASANYRRHLAGTRACAVLIGRELAPECPVSALIVDDPYHAFARATALYDRAPRQAPGIHPSANVDPAAEVDSGASVCAGAVIEAGAKVGARAVIGANCVVGEGSEIGAGTRLFGGVVVYHGCFVGRDCILHSNAVIGADGFGFAPYKGQWAKIHQLGGVRIGDEVEIGAGTCIDRGALGDTVIGRGVKIDNQVQIAHNVQIGDYTAIAACSAVAGSAVIGKHCTLAGGAGVVGHVTVADGSHISARALVTKSIANAGSYSSGTPFSDSRSWRRNAARFGQLDEMARRLKELERRMAAITSDASHGEENS